METQTILWGIFLAVLGWRSLGLRRMLSIPMFHGPDFFFNARVGEEFYRQEPGQTWMREFRRRVIAPRVIEFAIILLVGFWSGWNLLYLLFLQAPCTIFTAWWQIRVARASALQARSLQPDTNAPPVVTANLAPRETPEYRSKGYEWLIGGMTVAGLALLVYGFLHQGEEDARHFFLAPLILLYLQGGLLLAQRGLMQAPLFRISSDNPEPFLQFREEYRRWWMRVCDLLRLLLAGPILLWGVASVQSDDQIAMRTLMWGFLVFVAIAASLTMRETNRCLAAARRAGPGRRGAPPPSLPESRIIAGVFCWERDLPRLFIKGARGYALNLANFNVYTYAAYFAGFAVLAMWVGK